MLIVPLHRALTAANFPWMTLVLILANVFVFTALQSGDGRARERALEHYVEADLGHWEFPAYRDWLLAHEQEELAEPYDQLVASNPQLAAAILQNDDTFVAELQAGHLVIATAADRVEWQQRRAAFEAQWDSIFTSRWLLRFDRFEAPRLLTATFLHGSAGHLIGNMIFLGVLGLLVEGALGSWLFLALYLLGGIGASLVSMAWNWGDVSGGLGASGAIAALMGAYCVLWGSRRVRFFWWFFVVFDYVKAPALMLLPVWLGWEILNLIFNRNAGVGFDAHAGGIVSGALLALAVRRLGWERREFMDEDVRADEAETDAQQFERAQQHLGRLEIIQARTLLEPMLARQPHNVDLLVALYRCARYESGQPQVHAAARAVLSLEVKGAPAITAQKKVFDDYVKVCKGPPRVSPAMRLTLARRWLQIGAIADALRGLQAIDPGAGQDGRLAGEYLHLLQSAYARGERDALKPLLDTLIRRAPDSIEANKARMLLADC
jgi:membrane associated rhomboid family serine protease